MSEGRWAKRGWSFQAWAFRPWALAGGSVFADNPTDGWNFQEDNRVWSMSESETVWNFTNEHSIQ